MPRRPLAFGTFIRLTPLTVAVALGPAIDIAQFWSRAPDTEEGRAAQLVRGGLIILMLVSIRDLRTLTRRSGIVLPLIALGAYSLLWAITQQAAHDYWVYSLRLLFLSLVYLCALESTSRGLVGGRWIRGVAWSVLAVVLASQATGWALHVRSVYESAFEFPGITGEPGVIAASLCAALPIFFSRSLVRPVDGLGIALALVSIAGTQRRSAMATAMVTAAIYGLTAVTSMRKKSILRAVGLGLTLCMVLFAFWNWTPFGREFANRLADLDVAHGGTGSGRTDFQWIALANIPERKFQDIVVGEGLGALPRLLARDFGLAIGGHADWIDITYAFGVVGFGFFVWFQARLASLAIGMQGHQRALVLMAFAGLATMGLTTGGSFDPSSAATFALLGFVVGSSRYGMVRPGADAGQPLAHRVP